MVQKQDLRTSEILLIRPKTHACNETITITAGPSREPSTQTQYPLLALTLTNKIIIGIFIVDTVRIRFS
jgi:hypothetical protein